MKVLVSGASVAGPSVALWLGGRVRRDSGRDQPGPPRRRLRGGLSRRGESGSAGPDGRARGSAGPADRWEPDAVRRRAGPAVDAVAGEFAGGELEVLRADLSRVLYEHSCDKATYRFGDSIAQLTGACGRGGRTVRERDRGDVRPGHRGGRAALDRAAAGVRAGEGLERHLGYYIACWEVPNTLGISGDALMYNVPGRLASVGADRRDPAAAGTMFLFKSSELSTTGAICEQQKAIMRDQLRRPGLARPAVARRVADGNGVVLRLDQPGQRGPLVDRADSAARRRRVRRHVRRDGHEYGGRRRRTYWRGSWHVRRRLPDGVRALRGAVAQVGVEDPGRQPDGKFLAPGDPFRDGRAEPTCCHSRSC